MLLPPLFGVFTDTLTEKICRQILDMLTPTVLDTMTLSDVCKVFRNQNILSWKQFMKWKVFLIWTLQNRNIFTISKFFTEKSLNMDHLQQQVFIYTFHLEPETGQRIDGYKINRYQRFYFNNLGRRLPAKYFFTAENIILLI